MLIVIFDKNGTIIKNIESSEIDNLTIMNNVISITYKKRIPNDYWFQKDVDVVIC